MAVKLVLAGVLSSFLIAGAQVKEATDKDPHRSPCTSQHCQEIQSFLRSHYCGESPFGNGPGDGCEIVRPKQSRTGVKVLAHFKCDWNESEATSKCQQLLGPSQQIRSILIGEMRKVGLPAKDDGQIYFTVWESALSGWSVAEANYQNSTGLDLTLCRIIVVIDRNSHIHVLRKVPFQKTNVDVPDVTTWSLIDLADVDGRRRGRSHSGGGRL